MLVYALLIAAALGAGFVFAWQCGYRGRRGAMLDNLIEQLDSHIAKVYGLIGQLDSHRAKSDELSEELAIQEKAKNMCSDVESFLKDETPEET